jgi:hypothetical protein
MRGAIVLLALHLFASGALAADAKAQVLVLDLQRGSETPANTARTLTDLLTVEASNHPGLKVLSGADLRRLAELESEKAMLGCDDSSCLAELAGAIGARFVISGRLAKLGGLWLLQLSLFDASAAEAISRVALKATTLAAFVDELPAGVKKLLSGVAPLLAAEAGAADEAKQAPVPPPAPAFSTAIEVPSADPPPQDPSSTPAASEPTEPPAAAPSATGGGEPIPPGSTDPERATMADDDGLGIGAYSGMGLVALAVVGLAGAALAVAVGGVVFMTKMPDQPIAYRYAGGAAAVAGGVVGVAAVVGAVAGAGLIIGGFLE